MIRRLTFLLLLLFPATAAVLHAQQSDNALSDKEIEELRDSAYFANDRVLVFIKLIDARVSDIRDLYAHPRRPGREQDTHDLLEQFTALADELSDNLDDYAQNHRDIRKALPKLIENTERWATAIKSLPDDPAYNVSRNLALESIRDLREDAT
ncbi:MAG: hypothetical protein FWD64_09670, partial [Acidobacteriaceae bacterium]|nr:hypothetical protein [Acidobacteriaceae bacterium]